MRRGPTPRDTTGRADPIAEQLSRRTRATRHDARARHYALRTVRPSPARAAAPEPEVWLPITDLGEVLELEVELWASELLDERPGTSPGAPSPSGNVTLLVAPVEAGPDVVPDVAPDVAPPVARELAPAPVEAPAPVLPGPARPLVPARTPAPAPTPVPALAPAPARTPALRPAPGRAPVPHPAPAPSTPRRRTHPQAPTRPRVAQAVVLTATAAAVAVGAMFLLGTKAHQVTVEVDGRSFTRSSDAATVGDLLRDQHLSVGAHDVVAPAAATRVRDGMVVQVLHGVVPDGTSPPTRAAGSLPFGEVAATPPPPPPPPPTAAPVAAAPAHHTPSTTARRTPATAVPTGGHHSARGGASWYASPFGSDSCASRSLPHGTIVSIVNLANGHRASCRVADYGPVARSRVLDLDNDVFRRLSPLGTGVIHVAISW